MRREPAGDFDYDAADVGYAAHRRADPRIEAVVHAALGHARTVVNVGAGAGSYEPADREVTAVEPSAAQRAQRPPHLPPAVDAAAEDLPFAADSFDAAMATVTVHHWKDLAAGLREMRRVSRGPVVVLTFDPDTLLRLWFEQYAPELRAVESRRFPPIGRLAELLAPADVVDVPIPLDCTDGVIDAFYGRPEQMLDPAARRAQSAWGFVEPGVEERFERDLRAALADGSWDARWGHLRSRPELSGVMQLVVGRP